MKPNKLFKFGGVFLFLTAGIPFFTFAGNPGLVSIYGIRLEFILFGLVLLGVAIFHENTFRVAVTGFIIILCYKLFFDGGFRITEHFLGKISFLEQLADKDLRQGEWGIILNLFGLLLGFAVLAKLFEESGIPDILPNFLPDDWRGPFMLLIYVFILSSFLDNIAAALIGGSIAGIIFHHKVHIGYIAALVAASNAGGSGSVLGDTTTTMMWIEGVNPLSVLHGYIAAGTALLFFAYFASKQQDRFERIQKDASIGVKADWVRVGIVGLILIGAIVSNFMYDMPALGVWIALIIGSFFRKLPFKEIKEALPGSVFLICLVLCASMMPVDTLPEASWVSALILGFVSAVFDNIPLTKLCLDQGHYDWGMLAYTVGFGGSMVWFGSSAGVAISSKFHESRDVFRWVKNGWHVIIAYILGFFILFAILGWEPASNKKHKEPIEKCPIKECQAKN